MTGYGDARQQSDGATVSVEIRAINSRYFKLSLRATEPYGALEPQVESSIRKLIKRGTVQVNVRIEKTQSLDDYRIDEAVLTSYVQQLNGLAKPLATKPVESLDALLALPGVVNERAIGSLEVGREWPLIEKVLHEALSNLDCMRQAEGAAMADDLHQNSRTISAALDKIEQRAPAVATAYQQRLTERLNHLLATHDVTVEPSSVVREVGLFAERSDISEEVVRLRSHLTQFEAMMDSADGPGRKLEFLIQEMFREANTIGSKANDSDISQHVVEVKSAIERMREMVQNIE